MSESTLEELIEEAVELLEASDAISEVSLVGALDDAPVVVKYRRHDPEAGNGYEMDAPAQHAHKRSPADRRQSWEAYLGRLPHRIRRWEKTSSSLTRSIPGRVDGALTMGDVTRLTPEKVVDQAITDRRVQGVYFLVRGDEVVYVGRSVDVYARIAQHRSSRKLFDSHAIIPIDSRANRKKAERLFIRDWDPEYNRRTV